MKNLAALVLLLASAAYAQTVTQTVINFSELPTTDARLPIPNGYANMNWEHLFYVSNQLVGNTSNFAFPDLLLNTPIQTISAAEPNGTFIAVSMTLSGNPGTVIGIQAFNGSKFIGWTQWNIGYTPQQVKFFPKYWGPISTLMITARETGTGNLAVYDLFSLTIK